MDDKRRCECDCHEQAELPEGLTLRLSLHGPDGKVISMEETVCRVASVVNMNDGFRGATAEVVARPERGVSACFSRAR